MVDPKLYTALLLLLAGVHSVSAGEPAITIVYDAVGNSTALKKDWGFAALVEYGGKRILFDTGNDAAILEHNAKALNIDLAQLDFVIISHRHGDHIGGLEYVLEANPGVRIYAPHEGFGIFGATLPRSFLPADETLPAHMRYWGGDPPAQLRFGSAWPQANFIRVNDRTTVAPGFHIIALEGAWGTDLPLVELSLLIETADRVVIIAGCSHPTIEKILAAARAAVPQPVHLLVGGMHLIPAPPTELERIAEALLGEWRVHWLAPAHCTGEAAFARLRQVFGERYVYAGLGTTIPLQSAALERLPAQEPAARMPAPPHHHATWNTAARRAAH